MFLIIPANYTLYYPKSPYIFMEPYFVKTRKKCHDEEMNIHGLLISYRATNGTVTTEGPNPGSQLYVGCLLYKIPHRVWCMVDE